MAPSTLAQARRKKLTWIVLGVTVVALIAALTIRQIDPGNSPLVTIAYQGLGAVAGVGAAFVLIIMPLYAWQERKKDR